MIEHRCSARVKLMLKTQLVDSENRVFEGLLRNINNDGLFIETAAPLYRFAMVKISIGLPGQKPHMVTAMVLHRAANGLGLMTATPIPHIVKQVTERARPEGQRRPARTTGYPDHTRPARSVRPAA